jgi:hypothetical protein
MSSQRIGGDQIYGNGADGNVVISANTVMSRDMYYRNLTVQYGASLNTNGFKIFVQQNLIIEGSITTNSTYTTGTLSVPANSDSGNLSYSVGSNTTGNVYTVSSITDGQKQDIENLISGTLTIANGSIVAITGGAPGKTGANGTVTANTAGSAGSLNRNPGVPGGPGTPGVAVTASLGGAGGKGGPVTLIVAKNISGSGSIQTNAGSSSLGETSKTGANGTSTPNASLTFHTDNIAHYITGDGTHGPHATTLAPTLPHGGHVPYTANYRHGYTYHHVHRGNVHHSNCSGDCHIVCGGEKTGHYNHQHNSATNQHGVPNHAGDYAHHSGDYHNTPHINTLTATYYAINGIDHSPGHRGNIGEARMAEGSHTSGYFHVGHDNPHHSSHNPGHSVTKNHCGAWHNQYYYPRHHWQQNHGTYLERSAGSVSSAGTVVKTGGSAGTGGTSTAGANGVPGAGGGIIVISDLMSNSVTTSALGGSVANTPTLAPSGQVIKVIRQ